MAGGTAGGILCDCALQSCIEHLNRLDHRVHEEIQEIRSIFMDLLDNCQSDVIMGDLGGYDSIVNSQAGLDRANVIPTFVPQPAPHSTSFVVMGSLSEGTGLPQGPLPRGARSSADYRPAAQPSLSQPQYSMYNEAFPTSRDAHVMELSSEGTDPGRGQLLQGLSLGGTSDSLYEPSVQPFQGIYYEEHVPSSSSARPDEQLSVPIAQVSQVKDKVKCPWHGCSALVNKDNLNRHIKEVHEGKIKVVCAGCGKEFKRSYQLNEHIFRSGCGRS